ncbi:hypothetical protein C4J81_16020 [Deltaproteobacteria bacterium Smac51]|nr:hypothetical protein C4J81_16020 [Deltaproteobacteria bacterium Smac51]
METACRKVSVYNEIFIFYADGFSVGFVSTNGQGSDRPEISVTYFLPDERKAGGAYVVKTGAVKKINEYEQTLVMLDGSVIPIDDIVAMDGDPFE